MNCVAFGNFDAYTSASDDIVGNPDVEAAAAPSTSNSCDDPESPHMTLLPGGKVILPEQLVGLKRIITPSKLWKMKNCEWGRHWFSGVPTVQWVAASSDKTQCLQINTQRLRGNEVPVRSYERELSLRRLCTLFVRLKDALRRSKHGVLVCTKKDEQKHTFIGPSEGPELELWEPELDTEILNQQDIPDNHRVSKDNLPDDVIQQFWVENKGKKQTGTSSTM
jgi:hypothetical protein